MQVHDKKKLISLIVLTVSVVASCGALASAQTWKFGVISDTQWTIANDGKNPGTAAADIIQQVNKRFINHNVKFVVAVGDMVDQGSLTNDYTRALYAQELYNANIGFFPLRGNHEAAEGTPAYMKSSQDLRCAYPQIVPGPMAGWQNNTPQSIFDTVYPPLASLPDPPAAKPSPAFLFPAGQFFTSSNLLTTCSGGGDPGQYISYAFRYINATLVMLDEFKSPNYYYSYLPEQQLWIDQELSLRPANTHAFVFNHKNLLGGNHKDNMFGGPAANDPGDGYGLDPNTLVTSDSGTTWTVGQKQEAMNDFLASLQKNQVRYVITGHDHHHYNSVVTSPDQKSKVHQLICQSDSSKFYTPTRPVSPNDVPVEQELARIGYYIFTVDGPRVTIDYYADNRGNWQSGGSYPFGTGSSYPLGTTPTLQFVKRSTTGYSLNGTEKLVAQGASYAMTDNTHAASTMEPGFEGTSMAILDGINNSTNTTNYGKPTEKAVNTGWKAAELGTASDILTLWGIAELASDRTDTFVLEMSYTPPRPPRGYLNGRFMIANRGLVSGQWVNAVNKNVGPGSVPNLVAGPWKAGYPLGTYGYDPAKKTAWAVLNHAGEFAVVAVLRPQLFGAATR